jgi:5-(carboxyamino)imidazole ribonucleotide synthase
MHWYGKTKRAGRKMGHINVCGQNRAELLDRLSQLASMLPENDFPEVAQYVDHIT